MDHSAYNSKLWSDVSQDSGEPDQMLNHQHIAIQVLKILKKRFFIMNKLVGKTPVLNAFN